MELEFQYFIFIKLALIVLSAYFAYKAFTVKNISFKQKFTTKWAISAYVAFVLILIAPLKMDVNTQAVTNEANYSIQDRNTKLPERITDKTFTESTNVEGITKKDITE